MKVKIEIDCTPQEARAFFGLPDLEPLHDAMTDHMKERMESAVKAMDPESYMRAWMPGGVGLEKMQEMFFSAMSQAAGRAKRDED